jgi:hypothetical protein
VNYKWGEFTTKKIISGITLLAWLTLSFLQPSLAGADYWQELVLDQDGDGLPNSLESAGWRNAAGGPFTTNPLDPDSDDDGLTDGEEKLFDTNPKSKASPGARVEYRAGFKTREYFHGANNAEPKKDGGGPSPQTLGGGYLHWDEGGARRLMTEGVVVRRGVSFRLEGPPGATLKITKNNATQTDLSYSRNTCQGGWDITVDPNETVGIYTATLTLGTWTDKIPIYVIFELPAPYTGSGINTVTQADVAAFLYDDDPTNLRDETALWWNVRESDYNFTCASNPGKPCDNEPYHNTRGFTQAYPTDQYRKYIFRDRVMPVISGADNQTTALSRLSTKADTEIRVNFDRLRTNMFQTLQRSWDGTGYTQAGGACDANATAFAGFGRSAGILVKPFIVDWNTEVNGSNTHHGETTATGLTDTSVMAWLNNQWLGARNYTQNENTAAFKYYPFNGGTKAIGSLFKWYGDQKGDIIVTMNPQWVMSRVNTTLDPQYEFAGSLFGVKWDYLWDSRSPLYIQRDPAVDTLNTVVWQGDNFLPNDYSPSVYVLPSPYPGGDLSENWPVEPDPTNCSPETAGASCPYQGVGDGMGSLETLLQPSGPPAPPESVMFNHTYTHQALDTNGDGQAETLLVDLGLAIIRPGTFSAQAELYDAQGEWIGEATWQGGGPKVRLQFNNVAGRPGPYVLRHVYLFDKPGNTADAWGNLSLNSLPDLYRSGRIQLGTAASGGGLSSQGTTITPTLAFSHSAPDGDGDGLKDALIVNAGMTVSQAGTYRLEGWLVAANGELISWAQSTPTSLAAGNQTLSLSFDGRAINDRGLPGPYTLQELKILDGNMAAFNVLDEVQQTNLNLNFQPDQFETTLIFQDNMEQGAGQWSVASPWSLASEVAFSPTKAWQADAGSSQNGSLTSQSLSTAAYAGPVLRFQSCGELSGTVSRIVEVSRDNGNSWVQLAATKNSILPWTSYQLDLADYEKEANLKFRFRAKTQSGASLKWVVDDVRLNGWPALTNVSMTRSPSGPLSPDNRTFTFSANYNSIDNSVPISYVWRINGTVVGNSPTLAYTFAEPSQEYRVEVTVSNPYDSETRVQSMSVSAQEQPANQMFLPMIKK